MTDDCTHAGMAHDSGSSSGYIGCSRFRNADFVERGPTMSSPDPGSSAFPRADSAGRDARVDCGIHAECDRVVPGWVVFVDNAPTVGMFALGTILTWQVGGVFGAGYLAYCILAIIAFWGRICPWCHHFGTRACPCGYGVVAPLLFRARTGREFRQVFRVNVAIMFPSFFIPPIVGAVLLSSGTTRSIAAVLAAFCLIAFAVIPANSRLVGCKGCEIKELCPWMTQARERSG